VVSAALQSARAQVRATRWSSRWTAA